MNRNYYRTTDRVSVGHQKRGDCLQGPNLIGGAGCHRRQGFPEGAGGGFRLGAGSL
jgi:hypothetical protein